MAPMLKNQRSPTRNRATGEQAGGTARPTLRTGPPCHVCGHSGGAQAAGPTGTQTLPRSAPASAQRISLPSAGGPHAPPPPPQRARYAYTTPPHAPGHGKSPFWQTYWLGCGRYSGRKTQTQCPSLSSILKSTRHAHCLRHPKLSGTHTTTAREGQSTAPGTMHSLDAGQIGLTPLSQSHNTRHVVSAAGWAACGRPQPPPIFCMP